jgi:hypothetical protein
MIIPIAIAAELNLQKSKGKDLNRFNTLSIRICLSWRKILIIKNS